MPSFRPGRGKPHRTDRHRRGRHGALWTSKGTLDIDAEIRCEPSFYERLVRHLSDREIQFNIGEDIDHWSVVSLPTGYRRRTKTIYREKGVVIKVLDPLDFIASKLLRGIDQDL